MQTQRQSNKLDFTGQIIYVGIDAHLKSWTVTLETDELTLKTFNQPPDPETLYKHLHKNYPGAYYKCVYESGFCGFWIHDKFKELGIECLVVHPADIPTKDKEKKQKTDPRDSRKLARSLRGGELEGIYIHGEEDREYRGLIRCRKQIVRDLTRHKNRIKSFLHFHGIKFPDEFAKASKHWSNSFIKWLQGIELKTKAGTVTLQIYIEQALAERKILLKVTQEIRKLSQIPKYAEALKRLISISGIGTTAAMIFLTEIGDINRFKKFAKLCGYFGLCPNTASSGEKQRVGEITKRGNSLLKETLIECSWVAIRYDPALLMAYKQCLQSMEANKAIIKIAKKLLNRIRFVLKNQQEYSIAVVN